MKYQKTEFMVINKRDRENCSLHNGDVKNREVTEIQLSSKRKKKKYSLKQDINQGYRNLTN